MKPRHLVRLGLTAAAICVALVLPSASAMADTPAPGYEDFAGCPGPKEIPTVVFCSKTIIKSGHFQMGSKDVPISKPITLSGGVLPTGNFVAYKLGGMAPVKQL